MELKFFNFYALYCVILFHCSYWLQIIVNTIVWKKLLQTI